MTETDPGFETLLENVKQEAINELCWPPAGIFCLAYYSILKMEAALSYESSVDF
jgi:hypothetical protein